MRDMVRYVQTLRREADYAMDDRIAVGLFGLDETMTSALRVYREYLLQETLCAELLLADDGGAWDARTTLKLGGVQIECAVRN